MLLSGWSDKELIYEIHERHLQFAIKKENDVIER